MSAEDLSDDFKQHSETSRGWIERPINRRFDLWSIGRFDDQLDESINRPRERWIVHTVPPVGTRVSILALWR